MSRRYSSSAMENADVRSQQKRKMISSEVASNSVDAPKQARTSLQVTSSTPPPPARALGADDDDDDCVITGWLAPTAAAVRNPRAVAAGVLRALGMDQLDEPAESEYTSGSIPVSESAGESDGAFGSDTSFDSDASDGEVNSWS
jgi:hypothetical protein